MQLADDYCHTKVGFGSSAQYTEDEIDHDNPTMEIERFYYRKSKLFRLTDHELAPLIIIIDHKSELQKKFNELAENWKRETGGYSTMLHKASNNNYLDIIGLGMDVVPFILKDLQKNSSLWFAALKAITKENPVPKESLGDTEKMRDAWLQWGKERKHI